VRTPKHPFFFYYVEVKVRTPKHPFFFYYVEVKVRTPKKTHISKCVIKENEAFPLKK